jgi:hypothetical protein
MNINFTQFLIQCAAMGVWVFIVAGLYAIAEKLIEKHFPGFLDIEEAGASQAPGLASTDAPKQA